MQKRVSRLSLVFLSLLLWLGACAQTSAGDPPAPQDGTPQEQADSPAEEENSLAQQLLTQLSLEQKVGQLFLIRSPGANVAETVAQYQPGGVLFFASDFEDKTPDQARQMTADCQAAAVCPLLLGVDEEGGTVTRVSRYPAFRPTKFPSPQQLLQQGGWDAVRQDTRDKCQFLLDLGINVNLAPVCDVSTDSSDFIYDRACGLDAQGTSQYTAIVVEEMKQSGVGSVLKHFPGYGGNADTHVGMVTDERTLQQLRQWDFLPFSAGIDAGADAVLVSHTVVPALDAQAPASLSPAVHQLLRQELGFDGVILTDDLVMQAITNAYGADQAAVLAVQAGNDLLISTDFTVQIPAVLEAVQQGDITIQQLDEAVLRVLQWKEKLGLLPEESEDAP